MSDLLVASRVLRASLPSRSLLLPNHATSINNNAAFYEVGPHRIVVSCPTLGRVIGIKVISKHMQSSVDWK
jgi:hypothetical protein